MAKLGRYIGGVADSTMVKLNYAFKAPFPNFTSSPAGKSSILISGDNAFDPGLSLDNHRANMLHRWQSFYQKYVTYGSRIKVTFINNGNDSRFISLRAVSAMAEPGAVGDIVTQVMTDPNTRSSTLGNQGANSAIRRLSMYRSMRKILGVKSISQDIEGSDGGLTHLCVGDAFHNWYWIMTLSDLAESATTGSPNVTCLVKVTYYIRLFDRVDNDMTTNS